MMAEALEPVTSEEWGILSEHLRKRYLNVFSDEAIESHIRDYVGYTFPDNVIPMVTHWCGAGARLLDIGCGYGGFVVRARELGLDARGVELADFEVDFARRRLQRLRPQDNPEAVFLKGDARQLDIAPESLDVITLWNVIEHIDDVESVMKAVVKMLRPGGSVYIICPNYAAFRQEAHYHVPWYPFFPREMAKRYLISKGKDPAYFENEIFYRTNWGVLRMLARMALEPYSLDNTTSLRPSLIRFLRKPKLYFTHYSPLKDSVLLAARKSL